MEYFLPNTIKFKAIVIYLLILMNCSEVKVEVEVKWNSTHPPVEWETHQ
jgi:hypothetical protein